MDIITGETNIFESLFGENATGDPRIVLPIVTIVIIVCVIVVFRVIANDKGKGSMTEEELEKDRAVLHERLKKEAELAGKEFDIEKARAIEAEQILAAKRLRGEE